MTREEFARDVAEMMKGKQLDRVLDAVHGIGMPAGWQAQVRPLFEAYLGKTMVPAIVPASDIPEHQMAWLRKAPKAVLKKLAWAVKLSYSEKTSPDSEESGDLVLPLIPVGDGWRILMVGEEA
jgi:hypothetical protein